MITHKYPLSICIPSYNRARLLADLLERISSEITERIQDDVEIVISNNDSSDNTDDIVKKYKGRIRHLKYVKQQTNIGADRNFLAVIAAASGKFCWLMGDDDMPEPGGISRLLEVLDANPQLAGLSLDRVARSADLSTERAEDVFPQFEASTYLKGVEDVFINIIEYVGYISAQVIRRELWQDVVRKEAVEEYLNVYVHIFVIGKMLQRNPNWMVLKERLVTWRSDNCSFLSAGRYRRMEIDVVGYDQAARAFFKEDSSAYKKIRDRIATGFFRQHLNSARLDGVWDADMKRKASALALRHYRKSLKFWFMTAPFLFAPRGVLPLMKLAQKIVHRRRARRLGFDA